jgi:hypothetical protein
MDTSQRFEPSISAGDPKQEVGWEIRSVMMARIGVVVIVAGY